MSTAKTSTTDSVKAPPATGGAKKIVIGVFCGLLVAFLALEVLSLMAAQQTEQKRREVGMSGGRCETERRVPSWLKNVAGQEYHSFMDSTVIVGVTLTGEKIGDQQLAKLPDLPDVRTLDLRDSRVTSEGLKAVSHWKSLQEINLTNTPVTDVTPLSTLPSLKSLQLNFSQVRNEHLSGLAQLSGLTELSAGYTQVTDQGVAEIAKCLSLESLSLAASNLGEHGLEPLQAVKTLKLLVLIDAKFHAADLAALKNALPELKAAGDIKSLTNDQ